MNETVISVRGLSKSYGEVEAVRQAPQMPVLDRCRAGMRLLVPQAGQAKIRLYVMGGLASTIHSSANAIDHNTWVADADGGELAAGGWAEWELAGDG